MTVDIEQFQNGRGEKIIGVYSITCRENGRKYIGSSSDLRQRICGHLSKLRNRSHPQKELLGDFHKYGDDAFAFRIEQSFDSIWKALQAEGNLIAAHSKSGLLYNKMLVVREVKRNPRLSSIEKAELAQEYSYRPLIAKWPSIRDFADDIGVSPDNARVMKLRDSIPAGYWLSVNDAAKRRGIIGVHLEALASIEAGKNGLLEAEEVAA